MNKSIKIILLVIFLATSSGFTYAQNTTEPVAKAKVVKWEPLTGKENEFVFFLPQGFEVANEGGYFLGKNGTVKVEKKLLLFRYINGVALTSEYYEGDTKQIRKYFQDKEKLRPVKSEVVNGFEFNEYVGVTDGYYQRIQYYKLKNRLYVLKAVIKSADNNGENPIIKNFFESVKLINADKAFSPNVPKDATRVYLSNITERPIEDGDAPIDSKDADRKVLILYLPLPKIDSDSLEINQSGEVTLKVLFTASGKIKDAEVLKSSSKTLSKAALEAIKSAKFLPAEKDGKPVSAYQTQTYSFGMSARIFVL